MAPSDYRYQKVHLLFVSEETMWRAPVEVEFDVPDKEVEEWAPRNPRLSVERLTQTKRAAYWCPHREVETIPAAVWEDTPEAQKKVQSAELALALAILAHMSLGPAVPEGVFITGQRKDSSTRVDAVERIGLKLLQIAWATAKPHIATGTSSTHSITLILPQAKVGVANNDPATYRDPVRAIKQYLYYADYRVPTYPGGTPDTEPTITMQVLCDWVSKDIKDRLYVAFSTLQENVDGRHTVRNTIRVEIDLVEVETVNQARNWLAERDPDYRRQQLLRRIAWVVLGVMILVLVLTNSGEPLRALLGGQPASSPETTLTAPPLPPTTPEVPTSAVPKGGETSRAPRRSSGGKTIQRPEESPVTSTVAPPPTPAPTLITIVNPYSKRLDCVRKLQKIPTLTLNATASSTGAYEIHEVIYGGKRCNGGAMSALGSQLFNLCDFAPGVDTQDVVSTLNALCP